MMTTTIIWVLSLSVLGSEPEFRELPKYRMKQECQSALVQYQTLYKEKNKKVVGICRQIIT